jgi:hypothetical protein
MEKTPVGGINKNDSFTSGQVLPPNELRKNFWFSRTFWIFKL